jgi:uncharacterized peroxidase-related enzyme
MSDVVHDFTVKIPHWNPYLEPVQLDKATPEQLDAMKITPSHKKISEYVLTLAHDPESLAVRSPLFNLIMHGREGLSLAERELGAVGSSVVNRCIYCAAVHGSRYNQLTKRTEVIDEIFANGLEAELDDHSQGIFDFAIALAKSPPQANEAQLRNLADLGLSEVEMIDLVLSIAIFGWANRLMHVLGEPLQQ